MSRDRASIVVFGGGPAGCTAARLLALWGHQVRLVTKPQADGDIGLAESLTPSCGKFFDLLGIRDAIEEAGFVASTGNTVWWGSATPRVERFADGATGWQVTTPRLEAVMRRAAVEAGVVVEERLVTQEEAQAWSAAFRIDCTGRSAVLGRGRVGRVMEPGHRTVALSASWAADPGTGSAAAAQLRDAVDPTHTLIESYADGWAWSVPLDATRRAVAVMVDPQRSALVRGDGARTTYLAEIAKTRAFRDLLAGARCETVPVGWDASMYHATEYGGAGWLVAGDAATFVDPLSSAGVKKALASGWLAAIVAHTSLRTPAMADTARRFFAERERDMYAGFLSLTRQYLREGSTGEGHAFWVNRSEAEEGTTVRARQVQERGAVEAAHARLRSASALHLQRGPAVEIALRPAISGSEIVLERRLVTPDAPQGVRFLYDVDVVTVLEQAPSASQVPDLYDTYVARSGPVDLAAFLTALATAVARNWLVFVPGTDSAMSAATSDL